MAVLKQPVPNPFEYARELNASELVDREDELEAVIKIIRSGGKLFLIGPRRFGKTSILKAASEKAHEQGMVVLRYNVEAWPSLGELLERLVTDAAHHLASAHAKTRQRLRDIFSRLEPRFTFDLDGRVGATIGAKSESEAGQIPLIVDALNGIEELAARSRRPVGLILDEFQKVIQVGGESAEGQIRAAVQQHRHLGYVFAGSKTRMLTDMITSASRPFYRLGERILLGSVPHELFLAFINKAFEKTGISIEAAASEAILALAEEVPYNIQRLAHDSWEYLAKTRKTRLRAADVSAAFDLILRRDDPFYTQLWNTLSPQQRKALIAVIRMRGVNLLSKDSLKVSGLPNSTMQQAIKALKDKEILRDEEKLGARISRFEDPFFAGWIMMVTS